MTSRPHDIYLQGYTRTTMAGTQRGGTVMSREARENGLSWYWSLTLDSMWMLSLDYVERHDTVNTFPCFVHHAHHTSRVDCVRSG